MMKGEDVYETERKRNLLTSSGLVRGRNSQPDPADGKGMDRVRPDNKEAIFNVL